VYNVGCILRCFFWNPDIVKTDIVAGARIRRVLLVPSSRNNNNKSHAPRSVTATRTAWPRAIAIAVIAVVVNPRHNGIDINS
jgi:hypothetical protein